MSTLHTKEETLLQQARTIAMNQNRDWYFSTSDLRFPRSLKQLVQGPSQLEPAFSIRKDLPLREWALSSS
jgi:hypothetical protein